MYIYHIYENLTRNVIVRLPHSRRGDSRGQEIFLAPSADKPATITQSAQTIILPNCHKAYINI